jgi:hypothetical protein
LLKQDYFHINFVTSTVRRVTPMFDPETGKLGCDVPGCNRSLTISRVWKTEDLADQGEESVADQVGYLQEVAKIQAGEQGWAFQAGQAICNRHCYEVTCQCVHGKEQCERKVIIHAVTQRELILALREAGWQQTPNGDWACQLYEPPLGKNIRLISRN